MKDRKLDLDQKIIEAEAGREKSASAMFFLQHTPNSETFILIH